MIFASIAALALLGSNQEVLAFKASWCVPCKRAEPGLKRIEAKGFKVTRIDVDDDPDTASSYGVTKLPCFIVKSKGKVVFRTNSIKDLEKHFK